MKMKKSPLIVVAAIMVSMFTLASGPCGVDTEQAQAVVDKKQEIMRLKQEVIRPLGAEIEAFTQEQIEPVEDEIEELERGIDDTYKAVEAVFRNELEPMFRQLDEYWSPGSPAREIQDSIEQQFRDLEMEMRQVDLERQQLEEQMRNQPQGPSDEEMKWRQFQDEREASFKAFDQADRDARNAKEDARAMQEVEARALEEQRNAIWEQLEDLRRSGEDQIQQLEAQRQAAEQNPAIAELRGATQQLQEAQSRLDNVNKLIEELKVKLADVDAQLLDTPDKLEDGTPNETYGVINGQRQAIMNDIQAQNSQAATIGAEVVQAQATVDTLNPGGTLITPESLNTQIEQLRSERNANERSLEDQGRAMDDQIEAIWKSMNEDPMARRAEDRAREDARIAFETEWEQREKQFQADMDANRGGDGPPDWMIAIEAKFRDIDQRRQALDDYAYGERNRLEAEFEQMQQDIRAFEDTRMTEVEEEAKALQENLEAKYDLLDSLYEERELLIDQMREAEQEVSMLSDEAETELLQFVQGVLDTATEMDKQYEESEIDFSADGLDQQFNDGPGG